MLAAVGLKQVSGWFSKHVLMCALSASLVFLLAAGVWVRVLSQRLIEQQSVLSSLSAQANVYPSVVRYREGYYVRVVPNTRIRFRHGHDHMWPGIYAKIWHVPTQSQPH